MKLFSKNNFTHIVFLGVSLIAILAFYANFWFEQKYGQTSLTPTPSSSARPTPTDKTLPNSTKPLIKTTLTPTSTKQSSPTPTLLPTAIPLPTQPQKTPTPIPQNVQVKVSFLDRALICQEKHLSAVNQIIIDTENQLAPIKEEYATCKSVAEEESQICFDGCSQLSITCLENCGQKTNLLFQACDETYNAQKDPIVDNTLGQLEEYCLTL